MRALLHSTLFIGFFLHSFGLLSQNIDPDMRRVVGSAGDHYKGNSFRMSYTIGEAVIHTGKTSDRIYTQGFHQGPIAISEEFDVNVYNAFSPNGDGANEEWIIDNIGFYPNNKVLIFNRWGDRVRRFDGYNNEDKVWDGTNQKGKPLPAGTYYYVVRAEAGKTKKGYVQLTK